MGVPSRAPFLSLWFTCAAHSRCSHLQSTLAHHPHFQALPLALTRPQLSLGPAGPNLHPKAEGPLCCRLGVGQPQSSWGRKRGSSPFPVQQASKWGMFRMLQQRTRSWVNQSGAVSRLKAAERLTPDPRQGNLHSNLTRPECVLRPRPWLSLAVGRTCGNHPPSTQKHTHPCPDPRKRKKIDFRHIKPLLQLE